MSIKRSKPYRKPSYRELERRLNETRARYDELLERDKRHKERILELERLLVEMGHKGPTPAQRRRAEEGFPLFAQDKDSQEGRADEEQTEESDQEETITYTRKKRGTGKPGRKGLPQHLERELIEYKYSLEDLPGVDPKRPHEIIDFDKSEELIYVPPRFFVKVHCRPVVAYFNVDGESCATTCGGPRKVFAKSIASPELLAKIACDRLDRALTLYRMERWFKDQGCPLQRSTLCRWMQWLGDLLGPIVRAQEQIIYQGFKIHVDDTNVQVLQEGGGPVQNEKIWVLIGGDVEQPQIVFTTTTSRTSEVALAMFSSYAGYLQVDASSAYDQLFNLGLAKEVGCWSHAFRKFDEIKSYERRAHRMLRLIRRLCDIEDIVREENHQTRYLFRRLAVPPILEEIRQYVAQQREEEVLDSEYKKALNYVHNQWRALTRYLEDGRLRMDNNPAESEFHVVGITRRNHLFWGKNPLPKGLNLLSLIRTCRANEINPEEYLADVIRQITETERPIYEDLVPTRWKELRAQTAAPSTN